MSHGQFADIVQQSWVKGAEVVSSIHELTSSLKTWNKEVFGNIFYWKKRVLARLQGIQKHLNGSNQPFLRRLEKELDSQYNQILKQEEIYWYQKSRCQWLSFGDRNTAYFHTKAIIRRQKNRIQCLKDNDHQWIWDDMKLKAMATEFYKNLFSKEGDSHHREHFFSKFPTIDEGIKNQLLRTVTDEEVKRALFDMKPFKAPGPDGFQPMFFQSQWQLVGDDVCNFIRKAFEGRQNLSEVNYSLIVLIPKVPRPEFIHQFRPIGVM